MEKDNIFRNKQTQSPFYLLSFIGGILFWLLIDVWRGRSFLKALEDGNEKRNILFLFALIGAIIGISYLVDYLSV